MMSNFLNRLISRENGQTAAAVLPRLPSRYEPRDQKSPSGMYAADSHHETLGIEPGWEEGSLGMRKPHQRFDEPITSKPDRQSDLTAAPPQPQPATPISDRPSDITTAQPQHEPRNRNLEPSDHAAMRRPEPTHEHEPTAQREGTQTQTAPAHEMSHLVKPSIVPAAKGEV